MLMTGTVLVPLTPCCLAVIVVEPCERPVSTPSALMVATAGSLLAHKSGFAGSSEPSPRIAVAVNLTEAPTRIVD